MYSVASTILYRILNDFCIKHSILAFITVAVPLNSVVERG